MRAFLLLLFAVPLALGAPLPRDRKTTDAKRILGTWEVIEYRYGDEGDYGNHDIMNGWHWTFHDDGTVQMYPGWGLSMTETKRDGYKLDSRHTPGHFELKPSYAEILGQAASLGIYELNEDHLRICYAGSGQPRPKNFERNGDHHFIELKRVRPK